MSKETTIATHKTDTSSKLERVGFVPGVTHLALDVADRSQSTVIAVLGDARAELRTAVDSGIELVEKLANGAFRFARKLTARVDDASAEVLVGAERVIGNAVKSARETAKVAQELATTATAGVTGNAQA
jgi:hypothetical protein